MWAIPADFGDPSQMSEQLTKTDIQSIRHLQKILLDTPNIPLKLCSESLRSLLSLCCSNLRWGYVSPVDCVVPRLPERLCECEPWMVSNMKSVGVSNHSKIPAKIAAFLSKEATARFRVSRCQALSRIHYHFHTTACWLGVRTGTFLPLMLRYPRPRRPRRISCHGPPKGPHPPIAARRVPPSPISLERGR